MPQPILVTGGAGFIGSNFVRLLLQHGERVVTLDALTYAGNRDNLSGLENDDRHDFVKGSINDQTLILGLLHKYRPKAVVNLAAESHVDRSITSSDPFVKTNLEGTQCLLEAARRYVAETLRGKPDGFRLIHVSTDEVYGSLERGSASETSQYRPNSPYAASKAGADHLVRAWHRTYGLPTVITNCCNNYGPYQFPEKLIPLMIIKAVRGEGLPIYGDGRHERQWIYVEDHCRALKSVMENGQNGEVYNIGSENPVTNLTIVEALCAVLDKMRPRDDGRTYESMIEFVEDRPGHDRRYALDGSKIKKALSWRPETDFQSGLEKTVGWYLENTPWWEAILAGRYSGERLGLIGKTTKNQDTDHA